MQTETIYMFKLWHGYISDAKPKTNRTLCVASRPMTMLVRLHTGKDECGHDVLSFVDIQARVPSATPTPPKWRHNEPTATFVGLSSKSGQISATDKHSCVSATSQSASHITDTQNITVAVIQLFDSLSPFAVPSLYLYSHLKTHRRLKRVIDAQNKMTRNIAAFLSRLMLGYNASSQSYIY
jgi:hypothetical protein